MTSPDGTGTKSFRTTGKLTGLVVRCAVTLGLLWLLAVNVDLDVLHQSPDPRPRYTNALLHPHGPPMIAVHTVEYAILRLTHLTRV